MKVVRLFSCAALLALGGCAVSSPQSEWVQLLDASGDLQHFNTVGNAQWVTTADGVEAQDKQQQYAFLMTKESYKDFVLRVEFWVSDDANSGIYMRCQKSQEPLDTTCYEANIYDQRPDPTYATGGIVHVAAVAKPIPQAGGQWNTYEIRMEGPHLTVTLNGEVTADVQDFRFSEGHIGLQWGQGVIRFRDMRIKPL